MSKNNYGGSITTIVGPMCAGKSSRLITEKRKHTIAGRRVIMFKHPCDNRYSVDHISTHDRVHERGYVSKNPNYLIECGMKLSDIALQFDVVCIDEGQFYKDVDEFSDSLANLGVHVYVSALLGDYKREPFPNISRLMAKSENVIFMKAIDRNTGDDASFTWRKKTPQPGSGNIEVGGLELYDAVCRKTYFSL